MDFNLLEGQELDNLGSKDPATWVWLESVQWQEKITGNQMKMNYQDLDRKLHCCDDI